MPQPSQPDAMSLLRSLRAELDESAFTAQTPAARETLDRILATPHVAQRPQRGRASRRVAAVAATGALATTAVVLSPFVHDSPDVIAHAAAALSQPNTIFHFKAEERWRDSGDELLASTPDGHVDHTFEAWQTAGGRQERVIDDGVNELVTDLEAKTSVSFNAEQDALVHAPFPQLSDPSHRAAPGGAGPESLIDDLAVLLERARRGDGEVRLVGDSTIRGIPVHALRVDSTLDISELRAPEGAVTDPSGLSARPLRQSRLIYVDSETYLPVRVVELGPGDIANTITDYSDTQRLPVTPANEQLLRMAPHPGAREVFAGGQP